MPCKRVAEVQLSRLLSLEDLSYMESPISRLAAAEQQLLEQSGVGVFADLMLAETNLSSFCHTHSAEVEPLLHTTTDVGSGGRSAALDFALKLLSRTPLVKDGALEQALRAHFGVGQRCEPASTSLIEKFHPQVDKYKKFHHTVQWQLSS